MIRKLTLLLLLCISILNVTKAQSLCGFDAMNKHMMQTSPAYAQRVNQMNANISQWLSTHNVSSLLTTNSLGDTVYEIPVVVHVMHTGGAVGSIYNITDGRIDTAIDYLNKVFEASWPSYPAAGSGGTKIPLTFKLAKRSPTCGPTTGINRVDVTSFTDYNASGYDYAQYGVRTNFSSGTGVRDDSVKMLSKWPNDRYYNIWVVNKIDGNDGTSGSFTAGYAYLPWATSPALDGCVMLATQVRQNRITLPHEVGHSFGLYHTFEDSDPSTNTCLMNPTGNCATEGDRCCDTEPHYLYGPGTCNTGNNNPCTGNTFGDATARNIMNYANCQNRFTPDQRDRVIASLLTYRADLISSSATLPIPSTGLPAVCTPGITNSTNNLNSGPKSLKIEDNVGPRVYIDASTAGGYNSDGNVAYLDLTCQHQIRLVAGKTYKMTITSSFFDKGAAFIDYNNDGILGNSAGERLNVVDNSGGDLHTATFTVPFTATSCVPIRMRIKSDRTTNYLDSCSNTVNGQTEDYEVLLYGTNSAGGTVSISNPPGGGNPSCTGSTLTFRATPSQGLTIVGYQWFINSTSVSGQTADSFQSNIFVNNDTVKVALYYANQCGVDTVYSDSVIVKRSTTIAPQVSMLIDKGTNPTCVDDTITFKAVPTSNPGGAPTYKWMSNGVYITGATGPTFKAFNRIGETISVVMTSSAGAPCAIPDTALSNSVTIRDTTKRPVANVALTVGVNPGCAGQYLQFGVTTQSGGSAPTYQWTVNGTPVAGATGATFGSSTLNDNDLVRVIVTSNSACATPKTVTSDSVKVIHAKMTADIIIAQTTGVNPTCQGKTVIFSANTINAGGNAQFEWQINSTPVPGATSPVYSTDTLKPFDTVKCILITSSPCVNNPRDTSNEIVMKVKPSKMPTVSVAFTVGKNPGCIDSVVELTATAVDLGTAPNYEWYINGFPAANGSVYSTTSFITGNTIFVKASQTDNGCYLPDDVFSTPIVMKRSPTPPAPVISLLGNTIYTNFDSAFVWFGPHAANNGILKDGPDDFAYPDTIGAYYAVTNNQGCWSAPSNTLRITLLDISSIDVSKMDVYPNPASDKVVFDWKGTAVNYNIEVRNAMGQLVKRDVVENTSKKEINLSGLASGNYFIILKDSEGKVGVVKIAVESAKY